MGFKKKLMMTFDDLKFEPTKLTKGVKAVVEFPNGYGASIVQTELSYGGKDGMYELAVLDNGHITYDTEITNNVIGFLSPPEVMDYLDKIEKL